MNCAPKMILYLSKSLWWRQQMTCCTSPTLLVIYKPSMEHFQFMYGWITTWDKSAVSIINLDSHFTPNILMPSIDLNNPTSSTLIIHDTPVHHYHIDFLHIPICNEIS